VEVLVSEAAQEYVKAHGGTLFVRAHPHRCCSGSLTLLDATTTQPEDHADFRSFDAAGIHVRFCSGSSGCPDTLTIELRGLRKRHLVASWDGCAFKP
jgi:hypothetical protein